MIYACIGAYADVPYIPDESGLRIYSLEELAYYIKENYASLDESFMSPKLCRFVAEQLQLPGLSDELHSLLKKEGPVSEFAMLIINATGFCNRSQAGEIEAVMRENSALSEGHKRKLKGDNLLERKHYVAAIREYMLAISQLDISREAELVCNCYHNLGCSYAGMFYFEEASVFFKKAYEYSRDEDSYRHYLMALRLGVSREKYAKMVSRFGLKEDVVLELEKQIDTLVNNSRETKEYAIMHSAFDKYNKDDKEGCMRDLDLAINIFKREFREGMETD